MSGGLKNPNFQQFFLHKKDKSGDISVLCYFDFLSGQFQTIIANRCTHEPNGLMSFMVYVIREGVKYYLVDYSVSLKVSSQFKKVFLKHP